MNKKKLKMLGLDAAIIAILAAVDQYTKYLATARLKGQADIPLIKGVLHLQYLENSGAAFGLLQEQKWFILFTGILFLAVILFLLFKMPEDKKYNKLHILCAVVMAGAIGNMIDRVRFDYVIDFISFVLIDFPVFNFADICVTLSVIGLAILILFVYKEEDFSFLSFKQNKYREIK